jgi:hypothetical protein
MIGLMTDPTTGDLIVDGGSLLIGDTTAQTVESVLRCNRGELKEKPLVGAEVVKLTNGVGQRLWCARALRMIAAVGVSAQRVTIDERTKLIRVE